MTNCPYCDAELDPVFLELSFICPGCGQRVPLEVMWGLTDALDDRIMRTDSAFQAMKRGGDETEPLDL